MRILKYILISFIFLCANTNVGSQNLLVNSDFSLNDGSLQGWGIASGTSLGNDGNKSYAILQGENGVLYQKVSAVNPGSTYTCNIFFRDFKVKQTTGFGFAIEFETPAVLPEFTKGATNLRDFCESNSGHWTNLDDNLSEQDVVKTFNVFIPDNAKAVYICIGTKGALAFMHVNQVEFSKTEATNVNFLVKSRITGEALENAEIEIEGFPNYILTDIGGKATFELSPSVEPYAFKVSKDWYKSYTSNVTVESADITLTVEMDSIQEIKKVETLISKYGDNKTPYPIFGHFWNTGLDFSDDNISLITETLDYMTGGRGLGNSMEVSDKFHQSKPDFQIIRYQGGWDLKASELGNQMFELLYYRCGILSGTISENDQTIVINRTPDGKGLGLVSSEDGNFTSWIRIGGELMKIIDVNGNSYPLTLTVERGYGGSFVGSHNGGAAVTAPLYINHPIPGGNNSGISFFEPVFGTRKADLLYNAIDAANLYGQDGIWIDILVGLLGANNMVGGNYTLWNHENETLMGNDVIIKKTKDALEDIYNRFYSRMGYYPVIYGNNVLFSKSLTESDRGFTMVKNQQHQRVLDGFCHENSWGHMSDDEGNLDNDGEPVVSNDKYVVPGENDHFLEWYMGNTWIDRCKAIALLAENNLPNQPMTINAGFKNQWFANDLTSEVRYDFNKYSYASYLLCVNVTEDSLISCRMGISPQVAENGKVKVNFESFFYYPIGVPVQTENSNSFQQYRVGNQNLYSRKFSNGIVLINPFSRDMESPVSLSDIGIQDSIYTDPENNDEVVQSIQLKSRESKILLFKSVVTGINEPNKRQINNIKVYPVPAGNFVKFEHADFINFPNGTIELYRYDGVLIKEIHIPVGAVEVNVSLEGLTNGMYLYRISELNSSGKFLKSGL